jgi:uncharacterized membrane protein AbrB (regulator of aidB expression)
MKTKNILAVALATASCSSFAIGVAFTLTHGPAAFLTGTAAFIALAITATQLDPTI